MKKYLLLSILILGTGLFAQASEAAIVATVNDNIVVTLGELQGEIRTLPQDQMSIATTKEGVNQVLDAIIRRKLLADKALSFKVDTVHVVQEAIKRSREIVLADFLAMNIQMNSNSEPITEEQAREVYTQNESLFYSPKEVDLKQIVATSQDEADKVKAELDQGKKFDELMAKYPGNPQGAKSGNIGLIAVNQLTPSVVEVVDKLQVGKWGGPVQTDSGFHFLYLISVKPSEKMDFEIIKDDLIKQITNNRAQEALDGYLQTLVDESKITLDNSVLKEAILPAQPTGF